MILETKRRSIGIDVERMLGQAGNIGTHHFAAECEHEAIIAQRLLAVACDQRDLAPHRIDRLDLADTVRDTDRIEQLRKRQRDLAEIDLVIAHADVVVGIAVDDADLDVAARRTNLVAHARGADGRP